MQDKQCQADTSRPLKHVRKLLELSGKRRKTTEQDDNVYVFAACLLHYSRITAALLI
jgi:hypothetical protein